MKYAIISQEDVKDGIRYNVIIQANDGYEEKQSYVGDDISVVENAVRSFQAEQDAASGKAAAEVAAKEAAIAAYIAAKEAEVPVVDENGRPIAKAEIAITADVLKKAMTHALVYVEVK